jgi:hypothetical protein
MPHLNNAGWEAFAQGLARGLSKKAAYGAAGFAAAASNAPTRLSRRECVKERVDELMAQQALLRKASLEETILALLDLASKTELKTAAGAKEARAARLEAWRLSGLLSQRREAETWTPPREMTEAEWDAKYGPDAPGSTY